MDSSAEPYLNAKTILAFFAGVALVAGTHALVHAKVITPRVYDSTDIVTAWRSSIVRLECTSDLGDVWTGSGTLWNIEGSYFVTTNRHVADSQNCLVHVTPYVENEANAPSILKYQARKGSYKTFEGDYDYISFALDSYTVTRTVYPMGEKVFILGFPGVGTSDGAGLTVNEGIISGVEKGFSFSREEKPTWYVTSAKIEAGNSGGAAIASDGCFVGIPSWTILGAYESQGRLLIYGGERSLIQKTLEP
jgi:S1-C subfamily serine protease